MASYQCKKCGTKNTVLREWIELGINRVVSCNSCGHKMNLNLQSRPSQKPPGTQIVEKSQAHHFVETPGGTNVVGANKKNKNRYLLNVLKSEHFTQNLLIEDFTETLHIYIGRNPQSSIENFNKDKDLLWKVNDPYISRKHCFITVKLNNNKAQFILEDLNSANGTEVNGHRLESKDQILLNIGDEVVIGETTFVLLQQ